MAEDAAAADDELKRESQPRENVGETDAVVSKNAEAEDSSQQQQSVIDTQEEEQNASQLPSIKEAKSDPTVLSEETNEKQGTSGVDDQNPASKDKLATQASSSSKLPSTREKSRGHGHGHRHGHRRRYRRRPETTGSDVLGAIPRVKGSSARHATGDSQVHRFEDPFEEIAQPIFTKADADNDGFLSTVEFWKIFRSQKLNLALTDAQMKQLEDEADLDKDGKIGYEECIPVLRKVLMTVYQLQDKSPFEWIELATEFGTSLWFSKVTGQTSYTPPQGYSSGHEMDLFEQVIYEVFTTADSGQVGYLNREQLMQLLQSDSLALNLRDEEISAITQALPGFAVGRITYEEFVPVAKQLIILSYQTKDPSASEWVQLNSAQFGLFWFNKRTGETRVQPPQELVMLQQQLHEQRDEEIAFVRQTMEELEDVKYALEEEQLRSHSLEDELTQMAQQLDETGRALDEANEQKSQFSAQLTENSKMLSDLNATVEDLQTKVSTIAPLRDELENVKSTLHSAEQTVSKRDGVIAEREQTVQQLREQINQLTTKLEFANSSIAKTSGSLADVTKELTEERNKNKTLQKELQFIPVLREELDRTQEQLIKLQKSFDEKSTALSQTRKTMRNIRERNAELEKELGNMADLRDKLHQSRCETRTVKQFLAGKSTLVQERTRELQDVKERMSNMEEKDSRRARILAEVLERTARLYQQQVAVMSKSWQRQEQLSMLGQPASRKRESLTRSSSCPSFVPESISWLTGEVVNAAPSKQKRTIRYTEGSAGPRATKSQHSRAPKSTIPRLPPVDTATTPLHRDSFKKLSSFDIKGSQAATDAAVPNEHQFLKQLSTLESRGRETAQTIPGTSIRIREQTQDGNSDSAIATKVKVGDRVLVRLKTSEFEFESQAFSGQVKYLGAIDSEYLDYRLYAGVKLDEPVGQHDGVFKGKRYFTCPRNHGVMVRVQNLVAVLKPKSLVYKQVQRRPQQAVM